jgi:hypothetical protein
VRSARARFGPYRVAAVAFPDLESGRAAGSRRLTRADIAVAALAVALAMVCTLSGVHTGWKRVDTDELVYRRTLVAMQHGQTFYDAQREALIEKEHRPPTSVRAIRPPTIYLFLARFPQSWWRWMVGFIYLGDLLLAWRLARDRGGVAAAVAVAGTGIWLFGFAAYLFLHAEVWGLPFFLLGLLAMRGRRMWIAAGLFLVATAIRELYAVGLLFGAVWVVGRPILLVFTAGSRGRLGRLRSAAAASAPWLVAALIGAALYALHSVVAERVLSAHGYNARFGNEHRTLHFLLVLMAPSSSPVGELLGITLSVVGAIGAARAAGKDAAAFVAGSGGLFLLLASIWATRVYWSACWAIPLAIFVPAAISGLLGGPDGRPAEAA